jgi:hypothetical protein
VGGAPGRRKRQSAMIAGPEEIVLTSGARPGVTIQSDGTWRLTPAEVSVRVRNPVGATVVAIAGGRVGEPQPATQPAASAPRTTKDTPAQARRRLPRRRALLTREV